MFRIQQHGASYTLTFPAEFTDLLPQSAQSSSWPCIDVVQRLCWPAAHGQAAAAGSSQAALAQTLTSQDFVALPRGEALSLGHLCFLLWHGWNSMCMFTYLLPYLSGTDRCLCVTDDSLGSAREHAFLAFQPDNSLPLLSGSPVMETLQMCPEACNHLPIPTLFTGKTHKSCLACDFLLHLLVSSNLVFAFICCSILLHYFSLRHCHRKQSSAALG